MRLKRWTPFAVLAFSLFWSSSLNGLKFTPIYEALTIKAQKNSPPHIAFEELLESEKKESSAWLQLESRKPSSLAVESDSKRLSPPLYAKKIQLAEMVIEKNIEVVAQGSDRSSSVNAEGSYTQAETNWIQDLPRAQAVRVQEAERRNEILAQDWSAPTWSDMAKEVLEKSGVLSDSNAEKKVYVTAKDSQGRVQTQVPQAQVIVGGSVKPTTVSTDTGEYSLAGGEITGTRSRLIQGALEITGGLAVTNDHHIEIRRSDEGVLKELGRVDLRQGLYNIQVDDVTGTVLAKLVNRDGKVLGEGSFRLSQIASVQTANIQGPKIKIEPQPDFAGITTSAYNPGVNDSPPPQTRVTFIKGATEVVAKKDGFVAMDNVTKGSSTVLRAAAPGHLQTASLIVSGQEFKTPIYPSSMIEALQNIVSQQRALSFEGAPTIIWGKVSLDGKPVSGIDISVESDPSLQPIYFNQFMIPDPKLQATSENGLYAFVAVQPGFHSLLATRADSIFGYQNVVVEEGSVAQGDIESTMRFESVPLRIYDAFNGEAKAAQVTLQSISEELNIEGATTVSLPKLNRVGMIRVHPEGADYVPARYLYNDKDEFIHLPLVHWSWLSSIKSYLRLDDSAAGGVIVGFVPDEDFEVYLAAYDKFDQRQIVYFDMQGRLLQNRKGLAGGGFILYNVPEDTHEVVVIGARTQKVYSRVLPVDSNSLSVLSFRE